MSCMTCSASTLSGSSASPAVWGVSCRCPGDDDGDDVDAAEQDDSRALALYK